MSDGCACGGIDVHTHVVPERFPDFVGAAEPARWPHTAQAADAGGMCHRHIMIEGQNFRTVSEQCWSPTRRIADLAQMGLSRQVISPMPELLSYWLEPGAAMQLLRYLNEQIASMVAQSGGALVGLGAVPLQDLDRAIEELHHVMGPLGLRGVEIGSNINGAVLGDPRWLPFFEACEALDASVFVHAVKPTGMDRLVGPAALQQVLAYPTDVGLAAASVITTNLMLRCPRLRIAFSHGGGTLASLLPRLQQGWRVFPALRERLLEAPCEQARRLYVDSLVFDEATLRQVVNTFGEQRVMIGTDYPFNFSEARPLARIAAAGFDPATAQRLTQGNARAFLALADEETG